MIARSANGVIDFNMYTGSRGQSAAFFMLVGQSLLTSSITSLSQNSGPVGASVTITGANFGATQGTSTLMFNGIAASVTSWSATSITATVPSGATTGNVVVRVSGVQSNGLTFTLTAAVPALGPVAGLLLLAGMLVVAFYSLRRRQIA
jgi:uncharacterized protein (TIGR03437 family)